MVVGRKSSYIFEEMLEKWRVRVSTKLNVMGYEGRGKSQQHTSKPRQNETQGVERQTATPDSINQALTGTSCGTFMKEIKFYKELEK